MTKIYLVCRTYDDFSGTGLHSHFACATREIAIRMAEAEALRQGIPFRLEFDWYDFSQNEIIIVEKDFYTE